MVFYCCVFGSKGSRFDESVSMHGFPADEKRNCEVSPIISFTFSPNIAQNIVLATYSTMFFTFHLTFS